MSDFGGPHAAFIVAAYAIAALIVGGLVAWVVIENRRQKKRLADLEARGLGRRNDP